MAQAPPVSGRSLTITTPPVLTGSPTNELAVLRAQLAESQRFQEQVLSTVYWSLGTVASVAVLLVGFGWFTNFRMYDRDKSALERDLRAQILDHSRGLRDELSTTASLRFSELEKSLVAQLAAAQERVASANTEKITTTEKQIINKLSITNSRLSNVEAEVQQLKLAAELQKRESWIASLNYRNALQSTVTALELANTLDSPYEVGDILDLVAEDMNSIFSSKERPIDNFLVSQLVDALDKVKGTHAHGAANIKSQASKLLTS